MSVDVVQQKMWTLENLAYIKEYGKATFLQQQKEKYTCPDCGLLRTVHYDYCICCKQAMQQQRMNSDIKQTNSKEQKPSFTAVIRWL